MISRLLCLLSSVAVLLLVLAASLTTRAALAEPETPIEGRWTIDFDDRHASNENFQLSMERRSDHSHWQSSSSFRFQDFRGLSRPAGAAEAPIQFELVRDAGTFAFQGHADSSGGSGRFRFTPSAEFQSAWTASGKSPLSQDRIYSMAVHDVSRAFIRDLASLGYPDVSADRLITLRIHGATADFIRELQSLGYTRMAIDQIVTFRIHGVSPEYVRAFRDLGYKRIPADELVSMRIHGVSPEFVKDLQGLGYRDVPIDELVSMRIHGVSIEFARDAQAHDRNVSIDELVSMRIHGKRR